jgi:chitinase
MAHSNFCRYRAGWLAAFITLFSLLSFTASAQQVPAWAPNTAYAVNSRVTHLGNLYQCRQAHTSIVTWEPPVVPALFLLIGPDGGGSGADTQAPTAPANLRATGATASSISLAWNASTDNVGVTGYDVFQGSARIGGSAANSLTVTGLQANTSFVFTVRARDAAGNVSPASNALTARTTGNAPDTQAPTAPSNLRVTNVTASSVALSWIASSDNVGVTGYDVVRDAATVGGGTATSLTVSGLAASTSYTFVVRARDAAGNLSASSNQVVAMTLPASGGGGRLPNRLFVGYWHNFENGSGFIKLRDISRDYDVVNLSFGEPARGSRSTIEFIPDVRTSAAEIQSDVAQLRREGKKVVLSLGGANGTIELLTAADRQSFIDSVSGLITQYGLDGIDIDFEGSSVTLNPGDLDFRSPTTPKIINLISAVRAIADRFGPNFYLSMAPETFFVQVGFQAYGGSAGAYLPVIHGLRDKLTVLHVQHYNTGSVAGLDGVAYNSATADFQVALAEMLMTGFPVAGNPDRFFPGLREDQVAVGLPSSPQAAGSGFTPPAEVAKAVNYLVRGQSYGGRYVLRRPGGYPGFRGIMTFSINWDRFNNFVFSRGIRPLLNGLPTTTSSATAITAMPVEATDTR